METLKNIWGGIVAIWNAIWSAIVTFVEPYLIKFSNFVSPILQVPGKIMGDSANEIPLGIYGQYGGDGFYMIGAKGIFMLYFLFLMYLVIRLPKDEVCFTNEDTGKQVNLRPYSIASLSMIIVIYWIF